MWRFIKVHYFVCVHFKYDSETILKTFQPQTSHEFKNKYAIAKFIKNSDVSLGLWGKKSEGSVNTILKVYRADENDARPLEDILNCPGLADRKKQTTMVAFLMRMELYVDSYQWLQSSHKVKMALTTFIETLEDNIGQVFRKINKARCNHL